MPFVKLDCGILDSSLWTDRDAREIFITALLMAEPFEVKESSAQIQIENLEQTGWVVPPGWYGFVRAASPGIAHRAGLALDAAKAALERLGQPEDSSRSKDFDGRRMVRVDGGFVILNFMRYRDRDYTAAERMRKLRERRKTVTPNVTPVTPNACNVHPNVTQAEGRGQRAETEASQNTNTGASAPAPSAPPLGPRSRSGAGRRPRQYEYTPDFLAWRAGYPAEGRVAKGAAFRAWTARIAEGIEPVQFKQALRNYIEHVGITGQKVMHESTFLGREKGWENFLPAVWTRPAGGTGKPRKFRTPRTITEAMKRQGRMIPTLQELRENGLEPTAEEIAEQEVRA